MPRLVKPTIPTERVLRPLRRKANSTCLKNMRHAHSSMVVLIIQVPRTTREKYSVCLVKNKNTKMGNKVMIQEALVKNSISLSELARHER